MFGMTEPKAQWRLISIASASKPLFQCEPRPFKCSRGRSPMSSSGGGGGGGAEVERGSLLKGRPRVVRRVETVLFSYISNGQIQRNMPTKSKPVAETWILYPFLIIPILSLQKFQAHAPGLSF